MRVSSEKGQEFTRKIETYACSERNCSSPRGPSGSCPVGWVPCIRNERGPIGACKAGKGRDRMATRGSRYKRRDNRMLRTRAESSVLRQEVAWILVINSCKPEPYRFPNLVSCQSGGETLPIPFCALMPARRLVLPLTDSGPKSGADDGFRGKQRATEDIGSLSKSQ